MLAELKFVMGSVARKDYLPELTHFCIENGTVRGYNGTLALCTPIPFDIACKPKALPLVQAIRNCVDTVVLTMTPAGRLSIKSGSFKAFVECIEGETNHLEPEGERVAINGEVFLNAIRAVSEFMGEDASRPWSNGVLLKGQSAFATNNVIVVEYWTGEDFPIVVNIPRPAVKEILRIGEPPESMQYTDSSFSLHYSNKRWIRSQLLTTEWPELARILDVPSEQVPVDPALFTGLEVVKPFADKMGRVTFHEGALCTSMVEGDGARYELASLVHPGSFNVEMLLSLRDVAKTIDFSTYPKPCLFMGDRLRGAIIGMRLV